MKKTRTLLLSLFLGLTLVATQQACQQTPIKQTVTTLTVTGQTANDGYEAYLALVLQGSLPTNDVPKITALYREFQASFGAAAAAAHFATNVTLANPDLLSVLTKLTTAIDTVKKGGK